MLGILQVSASGLSAERTRLQTTSQNIANARTTRTDEGGAYKRKIPVFQATEIPGDPFQDLMDAKLETASVVDVIEDARAPEMVYDPGHPDADPETGLVEMPNVNLIEEMVDMITASRSYEANVTAMSATKAMALKALEIGR
ncbi:MAG: flagellar basal body rod protein FlgC [Myxococcota bacterium]|nr:flagellar basal body rod protein FlgC [Myxococcota bacterium]